MTTAQTDRDPLTEWDENDSPFTFNPTSRVCWAVGANDRLTDIRRTGHIILTRDTAASIVDALTAYRLDAPEVSVTRLDRLIATINKAAA